MSLLGEYYAPRIRVPQMIQRGKTQIVELAIYRDAAIVVPTSATYQLLSEDGTDIIAVSSATIADSKCKFTIPSSSVPVWGVKFP